MELFTCLICLRFPACHDGKLLHRKRVVWWFKGNFSFIIWSRKMERDEQRCGTFYFSDMSLQVERSHGWHSNQLRMGLRGGSPGEELERRREEIKTSEVVESVWLEEEDIRRRKGG